MPNNGSMVSLTKSEGQMLAELLEEVLSDTKTSGFAKVIAQSIYVKIRKRLGLAAHPRPKKASKKK
jgi:hypothetical protein